MKKGSRVRLSKFLSFILRHHPEQVGLSLQPGGWVAVEELLQACQGGEQCIDRNDLIELVEQGEKPRFSFDTSGRRVRANYGHSLMVDLRLEPQMPPEMLFHGTASSSLGSIERQGLRPIDRQFVHLSPDRKTAWEIGTRHGRPQVLNVWAGQLAQEGQPFYQPAKGTWLTASVSPEFIGFPG